MGLERMFCKFFYCKIKEFSKILRYFFTEAIQKQLLFDLALLEPTDCICGYGWT